MGNSPNTTIPSRISFASAGAVRAGPRPVETISEEAPPLPLPASPRPLAQSIGSGFMPVIYHPERTAEYLRFERIIRKAKATPEAALAYAERVLWYRARRAAEKRRHLEATVHPRFLAYLRPYLEAAE
jgi:hypothetical protein